MIQVANARLLGSKSSVDQMRILAKLSHSIKTNQNYENSINFTGNVSPTHNISALQEALSHYKIPNTVGKSVVLYKGQ